MLDNNSKLGRGLSSLLGENAEENQNNNFVALSLLEPSKFQPRTEFDEEALKTLANSIKERGVLQPLLVRRKEDKFEIIAGERRFRAATMAGLSEVPVIVKDMDDQDVLEVALIENLQRENLSAIEEAEGFKRLIDEFAYTQENLGIVIGKSRSHIANTLRLLNLPDSVKKMVKEGLLSAGHARALIGLENIEEFAKKAIDKAWSVRQTEEMVAKQKQPKKEKTVSAADEDIKDIEQNLIKKLGLRIKISTSKNGGGKVVLQYASVAELDMILGLLEQEKQVVQTVIAASPAAAAPTKQEKFTIKVVD